MTSTHHEKNEQMARLSRSVTYLAGVKQSGTFCVDFPDLISRTCTGSYTVTGARTSVGVGKIEVKE